MSYDGSTITLRDPDFGNKGITESMFVLAQTSTGKLQRFRDTDWSYREKHIFETLVCEVEPEESLYTDLGNLVAFIIASQGQQISVTVFDDIPKTCAVSPESFTLEGRDSCGKHWLFGFSLEEVV